jgi:hypothetical protein
MNNKPEIIRVEFGNNGLVNQYVILRQELRHGTQRAVNELTRPFLVIGESGKPEVDMLKVNWDQVYDVVILNQVVEWTFGPIDQETLDNMSSKVREELKSKCDELYGDASPLAKSGGVN